MGKEARTATTVHPELVAEWVKRDMGLPYYTPADPRPEAAAGGDSGLHPAEAERGHPPHARPDGSRGDHGAGVFRRAAPPSHGRRGRNGRPEGVGHRQRADGGGVELRRDARLSHARRRPQERDDVVRLRPWRRHVRRHAAAADARQHPHHRHRRRRAARRPRLGPADGRLRGRSIPEGPGHRPAAGSRRHEPRAGRGDRRQTHPQRPQPGHRARGVAGPVDGDPRHPRAVPRNDGRPAGAHGVHHAPTLGRGQNGAGRTFRGCCWWAGRRGCRWWSTCCGS